jgi:hypothetical protein
MKKTLIGATIVLILLTALTAGCLKTSDNDIEEETIDYSTPRTNTEAGINIAITYLPEITDATAFDIKVTAHKDYNDNFKENSYLKDSNGKIYKPLSYEGTTGHHASGTLKFPKIEGKRFKLVIQNVAGVQERVFEW